MRFGGAQQGESVGGDFVPGFYDLMRFRKSVMVPKSRLHRREWLGGRARACVVKQIFIP